MAQFAEVITALKQGKKVAREDWGAGEVMSVRGDQFVCHNLNNKNVYYEYDLSAFEILQKQWAVV